MSSDITIGIHQQNAASLGGAPAAEAAGVLAGRAVSVSASPLSLLADAAEELTFSMDNTEELDLKERREKQTPRARLLEKVALYQEMMHQAGEGRRADPLLRFLKNNPNPSNLLEKAKEFFPDPADAWASLLEARELLAGEGAAPELLAALDAAAERLEAESGPALRAGVEAVVGRAGYESLGPAEELRGDYRRTVCDFPGATEMFAYVMDKYGENGFDAAMDYLSRVLANDLAADEPSHDRSHLEAVAGNLGFVRTLGSAFGICQRLLGRWQDVHGAGESRLTSMGLMKTILSLKQSPFISSSQIDPIVREARPADIEHEVLFLQELLGTARGFSPHFFDGPENRLKFIDAIQQSLDLAIAREDEYLASLE